MTSRESSGLRRSVERRNALRIFVLSDTHNRLPENLASFANDADEIWHLGDVCAPEIIEKIATFGPPLLVVRGNCDSHASWPLVLNVTRNSVRVQLIHIPPSRPPANTDVVLHGHTHVPRNEIIGGVRFLNPGCVTRPNRGAPASVAILTIAPDGAIDWRLLPLT